MLTFINGTLSFFMSPVESNRSFEDKEEILINVNLTPYTTTWDIIPLFPQLKYFSDRKNLSSNDSKQIIQILTKKHILLRPFRLDNFYLSKIPPFFQGRYKLSVPTKKNEPSNSSEIILLGEQFGDLGVSETASIEAVYNTNEGINKKNGSFLHYCQSGVLEIDWINVWDMLNKEGLLKSMTRWARLNEARIKADDTHVETTPLRFRP